MIDFTPWIERALLTLASLTLTGVAVALRLLVSVRDDVRATKQEVFGVTGNNGLRLRVRDLEETTEQLRERAAALEGRAQ